MAGKPTKRQIEEFHAAILYNRIAWVSSRLLLERAEPALRDAARAADLDCEELLKAIRTFLDRHPLEKPQ